MVELTYHGPADVLEIGDFRILRGETVDVPDDVADLVAHRSDVSLVDKEDAPVMGHFDTHKESEQ